MCVCLCREREGEHDFVAPNNGTGIINHGYICWEMFMLIFRRVENNEFIAPDCSFVSQQNEGVILRLKAFLHLAAQGEQLYAFIKGITMITGSQTT